MFNVFPEPVRPRSGSIFCTTCSAALFGKKPTTANTTALSAEDRPAPASTGCRRRMHQPRVTEGLGGGRCTIPARVVETATEAAHSVQVCRRCSRFRTGRRRGSGRRGSAGRRGCRSSKKRGGGGAGHRGAGPEEETVERLSPKSRSRAPSEEVTESTEDGERDRSPSESESTETVTPKDANDVADRRQRCGNRGSPRTPRLRRSVRPWCPT